MAITSALVLFAVIWFMVLFVVLPQKLRTQGEDGKIEPGTHAGAPANLNMRRKIWVTTGISAVLWVVIFSVIVSGIVTVDDISGLARFLGRPDG